MLITVDTSSAAINLRPATRSEEIAQNVRTIFKTRRGTLPLARDFGLSWDIVDMPIHEAIPVAQVDIIEQIERYEPRARVVNIEISESDLLSGQLRPRVTLEINNE